MMATIEMIREKHGGAGGYLEAKCGLGNEGFDKTRANVVHEGKYATIDQK